MTIDTKRILFVDDEPNILQGLKRLLRSHRNEWDMVFASSGAEAMEILATGSFHVIVSDLRMPEMSGAQLLHNVKNRYPDIARFVLSGHADTDMILQSVSVAHQFLAKPCDPALLQAAIARTFSLREMFRGPILQEIVKDGSSLPALPDLYVELTRALDSPTSSAKTVSDIIARDITMSAKILQLVNSAFFGLSRKIDGISQAVSLLGVETIKHIVLSKGVFQKFDETTVNTYKIRDIYTHSLDVSRAAANLMKAAFQDRQKTEEALLAGLMHEIGKLAVISSGHTGWSELYLNRFQSDRPLHEQEREALGTTQAEVGAYLLGLWGLSNTIAEAIAFYQYPSKAPTREFGVLTILHLANVITTKRCDPVYDHIDYDMDYLNDLGIADKIPEYEAICDVSET